MTGRKSDREPRRPQAQPRMASYKKETTKLGSEQFRLREDEEWQAQGQARPGTREMENTA